MTDKNYSFKLFSFDPAVSEYGVIETHEPTSSSLVTTDFRTGEFFHTKAESTFPYRLTLDTENKLLTIIVDESGSATWNDADGDRYTLLKKILAVLQASYPDKITGNLIGFGGVPVVSNLLILPLTNVTGQETTNNFNILLSQTFEDSVFDLTDIIVVRNSDHYPQTPADGILVFKGIADAVEDQGLADGQTYYYSVWTENKNGELDAPQHLLGVARDKILPDGLPSVNLTPRILPGVQRDAYTKLIYNFQEKSGSLCFDSSGQNLHGLITSDFLDNVWLGDGTDNATLSDGSIKNNVGVRFNGDDNISVGTGSTLSILNQDLTVNLWIYRYPATTTSWLLGTTGPAIIGWALGLNSSGNVVIGLPGSFIITSSLNVLTTTNVPIYEWTMVTVVFSFSTGKIFVYKNGTLSNTLFSNDHTDTATTLQIGDAGDLIWNGTAFSGVLNLISVSNTSRDADYISNLYLQESVVFDATLQDSVKGPPDNGQREVLLEWQSPDDVDYNRVRIIRKYGQLPANENDGDLVLSETVTGGQNYYFLDTSDFVANGEYFYRLFTQNSLGNYCDRNNALVAACIIPAYLGTPLTDLPLPVANTATLAGNKKILLTWNNPTTGTGWRGTQVYYSSRNYPSISTASQGTAQISDGILLTDTTDNFYAHRINGSNTTGSYAFLINGQKNFYTIITYDVYGQFSDPVYISAIPDQNSTAVFKPDAVQDPHLEIVNSTSLSIQWKRPTYASSQIDLWMDESAVIFCNMSDTQGGPLESISDIKLGMCVGATPRSVAVTEPLGSVQLGPPAFNLNTSGDFAGDISHCADTFTSEIQLNYSVVQNGLIKGFVQPIFDPTTLAQRDKYDLDIWAEYRISKPNSSDYLFLLETKPVRVSFFHPISMALINKGNNKVTVSCNQQGKQRGNPACPCGSEPCQDQVLDGLYINSRVPYVLRTELQWKGEAFPEGQSISVSVYKANTNRSQLPDFVTLPQTVYTLTSVSEPQMDEGEETGVTVNKSVVDIPIFPPTQPENVEIVVTANYNGFFVESSTTVNFLAVLRIILNLVQPVPDGVDFAEQTAQVYYLNPDFPNDISKCTPAPDGTVVKWTLEPKRYGTQRPFYSTDPRTSSLHLSGVFSLTDSGVARHVFFGPVSHIKSHQLPFNECEGEPDPCCIGEEYAITVTAQSGGMQASDSVIFNFECAEQGPQPPEQHFLMNAAPDQAGSAPHWVTWADGSHLLKFQIARNPAISDILGADCFRQCVLGLGATQLLTLPDNQIISVTGPGEILWNVVFKDEDPYSDSPKRFEDIYSYDSISDEIAERINIEKIANIPLTGETTDFYVRMNSFVGDANPKEDKCEKATDASLGDLSDLDSLLPCEWKGICTDCNTRGRKWLNVLSMAGSTTLFSQNKQMTLKGGGIYEEGIPPLYLGFVEPLDFRVVDIRIDNQRVDKPVYDYISRLTYVVEVVFADEPVPDGTPISLTLESDNNVAINFADCTGIEDCYPVASGKIFTTQVNDPLINPTGKVMSLAYFTLDPLPNITFNATVTLTCTYDRLGTATRSISQKIELKNTVSTPDETVTPPNPDEPSKGQSPAITNDMVVYDPTTNTFATLNSCNVARTGAFVGRSTYPEADGFYIFGGFTGNASNANSKRGMITGKSEYYLFDTDPYDPYADPYIIGTWLYTTDMLTPRTFGMAVSDEWGAYCIGGLEYNDLTDSFNVSQFVERYDFATKTWSTLAEMPDNYGVAFGAAEIHGYYIYVLGGVTQVTNSLYPETLNDSILRYSIINDEWDTILPSDENLCKRISPFSFKKDNTWYLYGGSLPKSTSEIEAERTSQINSQINKYLSKITSFSYYQGLTLAGQQEYIAGLKQTIVNETSTPAYAYLATGLTIELGSESYTSTRFAMDTNAIFFGVPQLSFHVGPSGQLTVETNSTSNWVNLPQPRDKGRCVYLENNDIAYFIGGSNQNISTTLRTIDRIEVNTGLFDYLTDLERGRSSFMCTSFEDRIYLVGGLTSGHIPGFTRINLKQFSPYVQALGKEKEPILITLTDDAGQLIQDPVRVKITGRVRIASIDNLLQQFLTSSKLGSAQSLQHALELFPILYSQHDIVVQNGIASIFLEARSEDPLEDFSKLAKYIQNLLASTPVNPNEKLEGGLTRDELSALGMTLATLQDQPIEISSGNKRDLYSIETSATIVDDFYFGTTTSGIDSTMLAGNQGSNGYTSDLGGSTGTSENADPLASSGSTGQSLSSLSLVPLDATQLTQYSTLLTTYYNRTDWLPQIKKHLVENNSTLTDIIDALDLISYETPFGASQLFDAVADAANIMSDQEYADVSKYIYLLSDDSENLSLTDETTCIEDINAIDQSDVPVISIVVNTSFPITLSAMSERSQMGSMARISQGTGGQSLVLTSSDFIDQVVNAAIMAAGGFGYGLYRRRLDLGEATTVTSFSLDFDLPVNTSGSFQYRFSSDGYNFTEYSNKYSGSQSVDVTDFFARYIDFQVMLYTGLVADIEDPYSLVGPPYFTNLTLQLSNVRNDYLYLNPEITIANAEQVAMAFEGTVPSSSSVQLGAATSNSSDWTYYENWAKRAVDGGGKVLLVKRDRSTGSLVPDEYLTTDDNVLFRTPYGPWDPTSGVSIYSVDKDGVVTEVGNYRSYPRQGKFYFSTRQNPNLRFKIDIVNANQLRVGVKISNRDHRETVSLEGVGFIYNTNDIKPPPLFKAPPAALNAKILPASPNTASTFTAQYTYFDITGQPERGTTIAWFRNNVQLYEIDNKTTWSNSNLLLSNKLQANDKLYYTVKVSDGTFFGAIVNAPYVTIVPTPPSALNLKIIATRANVVSTNVYDTSSLLTAIYTFSAEGTGLDAAEDGTIIKWYVNGSLFKQGTYSTLTTSTSTVNPLTISVGEISNGLVAHVINNQIQVEVTPKTRLSIGATVKSPVIVMSNSVPIARNMRLRPTPATTSTDLELTYTLDDQDITRGYQTDQSTIAWFKSTGGNFNEVLELRCNVTTGTCKTVPKSYLKSGDRWYARLTPYDGLSNGASANSNIVLVL